ncbi:TlpA disulfide reductase family protein [Bacterioplanoides sp. SCSIO 12839]|uniref:TlpA family protein disulfide reductase n=1 Tax=Bacterioplanoides sp. SCSIO 12839 TaxID=2829569 RepID=UPI002106F8D7|nr:TlpA disulfide reductase family protein [Bacterioplanoides sp. SCSIO 12839]
MRFITSIFVLLFSATTLSATVGEKAPGFKLPLVTKKGQLSLSEYRGKVVYVDFWASWCGPCRKSLPLLNDMRNELKGQPFEVLAINLDEDIKDARGFLKQFPVSYPTLHDGAGNTPEDYELKGMPTSYLIDKNGIVQAVHTGFKPSDMTKIRKEVASLLGLKTGKK